MSINFNVMQSFFILNLIDLCNENLIFIVKICFRPENLKDFIIVF